MTVDRRLLMTVDRRVGRWRWIGGLVDDGGSQRLLQLIISGLWRWIAEHPNRKKVNTQLLANDGGSQKSGPKSWIKIVRTLLRSTVIHQIWSKDSDPPSSMKFGQNAPIHRHVAYLAKRLLSTVICQIWPNCSYPPSSWRFGQSAPIHRHVQKLARF